MEAPTKNDSVQKTGIEKRLCWFVVVVAIYVVDIAVAIDGVVWLFFTINN